MKSLLPLILLFFLFGCNSPNTYISKENTYDKVFIDVEWDELIKLPFKYHNCNVKISGYFMTNRNETAIYSNYLNTKNGIWLRFSKELYNDEDNKMFDLFDENPLNEKNVLINGKFNAKFKGNLSGYIGTIEDINYISSTW